jgi:hypothetical protein
MIRQHHGVISILVHPDYILEERAREVYLQLLRFLNTLRAKENLWITTPGSLNEWWRTRSTLNLVPDGSGWRIRGAGSERARIAFARLEGDTIRYEIQPPGSTPLPGDALVPTVLGNDGGPKGTAERA